MSKAFDWMDGKSSLECPVTPGVPKSYIIGLRFSDYTLMTFQVMLSVILLSMLILLSQF